MPEKLEDRLLRAAEFLRYLEKYDESNSLILLSRLVRVLETWDNGHYEQPKCSFGLGEVSSLTGLDRFVNDMETQGERLRWRRADGSENKPDDA